MYSFNDFIHVLWSRKKMIVILTLCFMGIGCAGFVFMKGFQYTNQVSFLLPATETAKEDEGEDELEVENQVISSNIKLIETYKEMIKSDSLLQAIQEDYPQQSKQQLLDSLTVSNSINSQIFTVSITTKSPEQSNEIAMSLSEKFPQIVKQSSLPRDVFLLSAETAETVRTPGFSKLLIGAWFASFMLSTSCSFAWTYLYERKYLRSPEAAQLLIETENIGIVDVYEL